MISSILAGCGRGTVAGAVYVNTCYALEDCAQRVARGFDDVLGVPDSLRPIDIATIDAHRKDAFQLID